ncbi:small toxic polypeptide [Chimaeribacter californicus]|uniref:Small toxic polypeptide n=1 Tax=Chimaeribacter californicus TaxID=2060067 RepID=A0A2N5E8L5_9GAMM|nr:Hok/Gef family protein [Chimaeribacter californicus]PLR38007.1 small toxic polypeptide [Chimaeribacter californicus]
MLQKFNTGVFMVCFTILVFTWLVRDSLCELQVTMGNTTLAAVLAYEVKR